LRLDESGRLPTVLLVLIKFTFSGFNRVRQLTLKPTYIV
jgi:hypothetical protein